MDIDDIAIMTPEDYATYMANKATSAIAEVAVDHNVQTLGVYNLNGIRVADTEKALGDAKGIFIVRTTEGAQKVIR